MRVRMIGQPFADEANLIEILPEMLDGMGHLTAVVAWVKRSGLSRVGAALESFRRRGGHSRLVTGIDEGGATEQGLRMALELFDEVYVFHDVERRTFHPKFHLAEGGSKGALLLGSNNLTAGGA